MAQGFLAIVLHAHLPYVRHPEHRRSLEEKWFFEAITECYIPLLMVFEQLHAEGIDYRLTFSLSPTLVAMLEDPLLQERYRDYLRGLQELTGWRRNAPPAIPTLHPSLNFTASISMTPPPTLIVSTAASPALFAASPKRAALS